jgi:hypothetical protein
MLGVHVSSCLVAVIGDLQYLMRMYVIYESKPRLLCCHTERRCGDMREECLDTLVPASLGLFLQVQGRLLLCALQGFCLL